MSTTHIEKFIEDAEKGGYNTFFETSGSATQKYHSDILLDPNAWRAVGETRGWKTSDVIGGEPNEWKYAWKEFIQHLADGKSIDQALEALNN